ncbi:hypothetical protein D3C81_1101030 [compost metagenome]
MQDVAVTGTGRGQPLVDQLHPLAQGVVFLHHLSLRRNRRQVLGLDHQARQVDVGRQLVKVCFLGIGQHQRLGRVVDARAVEQLAVGPDLQQFGDRVALQCRVPVFTHVRTEGREIGLIQRLIIQVFQHLRRRQLGKVDCAHALTSNTTLSPR